MAYGRSRNTARPGGTPFPSRGFQNASRVESGAQQRFARPQQVFAAVPPGRDVLRDRPHAMGVASSRPGSRVPFPVSNRPSHSPAAAEEVYSASLTPASRRLAPDAEVRIASRARGALPDARGGRGMIANEPRAARLPAGSPRPAPWVSPGPSRRRMPVLCVESGSYR